MSVAAAAAGDASGDGLADIVIVVAGQESAGSGVYLLRGQTDIRGSGGSEFASTFSLKATLGEIRAPVAAKIVEIDSGSPGQEIVVTDASTAGQRVTILRGDLTVRAQFQTNTAASTYAPYIAVHNFAIDGPSLVVSDGADVRLTTTGAALAATLTAPPAWKVMMPPPDAGISNWQGAVTSDWVGTGTQPFMMIVTGDTVYFGRPPQVPPGPFEFTRMRPDAGTAWTGQTIARVTADTTPDVLGVQPGTNADICAWDPLNPPVIACFATGVSLPATGRAHLIVDELSGGAPAELIFVQSGTTANASVYGSFTFSLDGGADGGAVLISDAGITHPTPMNAIPLTGVFFDAGTAQKSIALVQTNGRIGCLEITGGVLQICTP